MPAFLASLLESLVVRLVTRLMAYYKAKEQAQAVTKATDAEVDQRLARMKEAYAEAFNGQPVTPEQRKRLNESFSDFIRHGNSNGL